MVRTKATPSKIEQAAATVVKPEPEIQMKKKRRHKSGTVALREMKKLQRSSDLLIPKLPMQRLIKEYSKNTAVGGDIKWRKDAVEAVHTALEDFLQERFKNLVVCSSVCRGAKTIQMKDTQTLKALGLA
jgi:histone H3/H4